MKSDSLANEDSDNLDNLSTRVVLSEVSFDHIDLSELSRDEKNEDGDVVGDVVSGENSDVVSGENSDVVSGESSELKEKKRMRTSHFLRSMH